MGTRCRDGYAWYIDCRLPEWRVLVQVDDYIHIFTSHFSCAEAEREVCVSDVAPTVDDTHRAGGMRVHDGVPAIYIVCPTGDGGYQLRRNRSSRGKKVIHPAQGFGIWVRRADTYLEDFVRMQPPKTSLRWSRASERSGISHNSRHWVISGSR